MLKKSETIRPIELKFHMKSPYDRLANIYINCSGHTTKMASTPILMLYYVQLKNMYSYLNSSLKLSDIVRGLSC